MHIYIYTHITCLAWKGAGQAKIPFNRKTTTSITNT